MCVWARYIHMYTYTGAPIQVHLEKKRKKKKEKSVLRNRPSPGRTLELASRDRRDSPSLLPSCLRAALAIRRSIVGGSSLRPLRPTEELTSEPSYRS